MKHVAMVLGTMVSVCSFACGGAGPEGPASASIAESASVTEAVAESVPAGEAVDRGAEETTFPSVTFVAARGCEGLAGTWRGQVYSRPHGGYYEFTAQIAPPREGEAGLSGSIVARSWEGTPADVAPPDACGSGYHWTVEEDAAGQLRNDGSLSFGATSWRVGEHFCGDTVTDYSLDQLEDLRPNGAGDGITKLTGFAMDGVVWTGGGLPIELTRIACE